VREGEGGCEETILSLPFVSKNLVLCICVEERLFAYMCA